LRAHVSAGTYIRSIAADLWQILGTWGYISRLRRTKIGKLDIQDAQVLETITEDAFLDIKKLFSNESFITLEEEVLEKLNHWLKVKYSYNRPDLIGKHLFVLDSIGNVSNVISYDGEYLIPIKRI
jgi:tRNA U55 pseudouridine synthase TruB